MIDEIKKRTGQMLELETALMTAGPSKADMIIRKQTEIQEHYYADVSELMDTIEATIYQLEKLEPSLEMPERGYVRNCFTSILRTLREGI